VKILGVIYRFFSFPLILLIFCFSYDFAIAQTLIEKSLLNRLSVPKGFSVNVFAENLGAARGLGISPDGDLFVCSMRAGELIVLPDADKDGIADKRIVFADGLRNPHSVAFHDGYIYIGETDKITRFRDDDGDLVADGKGEAVITGLPTRGHFTKTIVFGPDDMMYLSIGSSCNICEERDPRRAAVVRYTPDGKDETIFAAGLRNSVALAFNDATGELWSSNNGRDRIGDNIPPEEINILREGGHYGWPYCYGDGIMNPEYAGRNELCNDVIPPVFNMQAHSAPLGMRFYYGTQFPEEFRGDLYIAFHGSWNRTKRTGYKVVRVILEEGVPVRIEDFVSGWLHPTGSRWGRPVDVEIGSDGSMFISDDYKGAVYRVSYK